MGYLIAYFMDNPYNHTEQDAYLFATGLALSLIIIVLVFHPAQLFYFQSSLKLRVASCCLIYNKVLFMNCIESLHKILYFKLCTDSQSNKIQNVRWISRASHQFDVKRC